MSHTEPQPQQQGPTPAPGVANPEAPGANPEVGIGDLFRILTMIEQAVVSGKAEIPVVHLLVAGRRINLGPTPIKVVG